MRSQATKSRTRRQACCSPRCSRRSWWRRSLVRSRRLRAGPRTICVLRVGTTSDLITDNPWAVSAGSDWSVVTIQYDMLLKFASEDLGPAPSLATGCEPNEDSTEWTCTLRDGLQVERRHAAHLPRRRLHLPVRDRQQDPAVPQLLPVRPDLRNARRHDLDLEVDRADVRARHAAVGLHRAREGVVRSTTARTFARSRAWRTPRRSRAVRSP